MNLLLAYTAVFVYFFLGSIIGVFVRRKNYKNETEEEEEDATVCQILVTCFWLFYPIYWIISRWFKLLNKIIK